MKSGIAFRNLSMAVLYFRSYIYNAPMESLPVPTLNGYVFAERLGSGSYAAVFRATSRVPNESGIRDTFAIKCVVRSKIAGHSSASNNLVREIGILKTLKHPHIVQLKDFNWDTSYIYLVMEYCSGGDLSCLIRQHRAIPEGVTQRFLQQLASALCYLRSRSISHMDLKPQNILLSSKHPPVKLKLADFGFSQIMGDSGRAFSVRGSPLYMAPEILNNRYYDARVDLWSVGVILYECLFGRAPLASSSLEELQVQIAQESPIYVPKQTPTGPLSSLCWDLLNGLLQREPDKRISFEDFFEHPWVDLDHIPSEETLEKATNLAQNAVNADRANNHAEAIKLYCKALEYFLPSLQLFHNKDEQENMRRRIRGYIQRAEALKANLRPPKGNLSSSLEKTLSERDFVRQLWADTPQVPAAITVAEAAGDLEKREQFPQALNKYTLAIESMLGVLRSEGSCSRKDSLMALVEKWMDRAECLKSYLAVRNMQLKSMSLHDIKVDEVDEHTKQISKESQCIVQ